MQIRFSQHAIALIVATLSAAASAQDAPPQVNTPGEVAIETEPDSTVLLLPMTGSFEQHPAAIEQLMLYAARTAFVRGAPFGVYYSDPQVTAEAELQWAVALPVAPEATATPPFQIQPVPERQVVTLVCTGPYEGSHSCWEVLFEFVAARGLVLAGPGEEHWLSDPQTTPPERIQTRIVLPVVPLAP